MTTDFNTVLQQLNQNLAILLEREAKYGGNAPPELLNQITDHRLAIELTTQSRAGAITEAAWREQLRPLLVSIRERSESHPISYPEQPHELRNRQIMLQRVHDSWVKGVLEDSLHNEILIELGMAEQKEAVEHPWEMVIQCPNRPNHSLPPGTKIIDVFDESGGSLLILGEPGSGKTTTLLELARRLIARAQVDPVKPIPAVFNLSTWTEKRLPLEEWVAEELNTRYRISKVIARHWIDTDNLVLLLDGLDEVAVENRDECVIAINKLQESFMGAQVDYLNHRFEAIMPALTCITLLQVKESLCEVTRLILESPLDILEKESLGDILIACASEVNHLREKDNISLFDTATKWGKSMTINNDDRFVLDLSHMVAPSYSVPITMNDNIIEKIVNTIMEWVH